MNYIDNVKSKLKKYIKVGNNLLELYALLVLVKGQNVTAKDVHDAWAIDKNRTFKEHRSIIPFKELSLQVQKLDDEYVIAIKNVSIEVEYESMLLDKEVK